MKNSRGTSSKPQIYVFGTRGFPDIQGGVEKHCEQLYPLTTDKYDVYVFRRKPYLPKDKNYGYQSIHFIDLPSTRIKGFESFYHSLLCTIYSILKRPNLVHIHNIGPGMFTPLLRLTGIKVILTYHSPNYEHQKWNTFAKKILKASEWIATKGANQIIFVNNSQINRFNKKIKAKSVYIPNGVNIKPRSSSTNFIEKLDIEPQRYILTVGRITQEKGLDYLIEAFLRSDLKDYRLVIAGGIDHSSDYAKQITRKALQNNVIMTGYVDGEYLCQLYSHASMFILPSYNEGFPLVLLEAMSYGLPILASDIPANKQLGLGGDCYFDVGCASALSKKIRDKIENGKTETYNLEMYSWDNISHSVVTLYEKVINE